MSEQELNRIFETIGDCYTINQSNITKGRFEYYNVYGTVQRKVFKGYAGNQPDGVTKFPTSGGFYWSDSGGPEISVSVSFVGIGDYLDFMSVSVNIGNSSTSGRFVNVPTTTDYYKLFIEKEFDCKPFVTYYKNSTGEISVKGRNVIKIFIRDVAYAKKVQ